LFTGTGDLPLGVHRATIEEVLTRFGWINFCRRGLANRLFQIWQLPQATGHLARFVVIPPDDPSEPCYEAETVNLLREIQERAERGEVAWLQEHGKVYAAIEAA
jgi:hypothetical protein